MLSMPLPVGYPGYAALGSVANWSVAKSDMSVPRRYRCSAFSASATQTMMEKKEKAIAARAASAPCKAPLLIVVRCHWFARKQKATNHRKDKKQHCCGCSGASHGAIQGWNKGTAGSSSRIRLHHWFTGSGIVWKTLTVAKLTLCHIYDTGTPHRLALSPFC